MCSASWPWRTGHGAHGIRTACTCAAAVYACACTAIYAAAAALLCCACIHVHVLYMYMHTCMCCCATVHVLLRCCAAAGTCAHMYKGCYKGIIIKYGRTRTRRDASSVYTCTYTLTLKVISSPNEKIGQLQLER